MSRIRIKEGLSQADLAAKCQRLGWDISREVLARIEGRVRCVTDAELVFLARALAVTLQDLLPDRVKEVLLASAQKSRRKG